ncbi:PREDICTED: uncharacterized protein LOC109332720 [Lupinus angustifolius]|uniref:uncharacterized protein LOC109332720 n=1 Tax=Lupinus angustifolius TaxID=3871 RepID=UPI00092EE710|nr:PREDICTED: uncharacterized protein LOC109332720 [Lupinus angustifolius]
MRRQYELMQMENSEKIGEFFNRVVSLTNAMKALGETMTDQTILEKILRTLTPRFHHIVVAIEESKKMEDLKIDQLQGSLEAHEQRILERSIEKPTDQALQAQTSRKRGFHWRGGPRTQSKNKDIGKGHAIYKRAPDPYEHGRSKNNHTEAHITRGNSNWRGGKKRVDRNRIKFFNCKKIGHFSTECQAPGEGRERPQVEANLIKESSDSEEDTLLLMMTTNTKVNNAETWYLDS